MRSADSYLILAVVLAVVGASRAGRRPHSLRFHVYLRSLLWRARRQIWFLRAAGRCRQCGGRKQLTVDHLTYARLGHERACDVAVLCWRCHQLSTVGNIRGATGAAAAGVRA